MDKQQKFDWTRLIPSIITVGIACITFSYYQAEIKSKISCASELTDKNSKIIEYQGKLVEKHDVEIQYLKESLKKIEKTNERIEYKLDTLILSKKN